MMNDKIHNYIALLTEWNEKSNIVGYKTAQEIEKKLIDVNLRALEKMTLNGDGADIGSGNGSLGILVKMIYPEKLVYFVERNKKKAAFIRYALHSLGITHYEIIAEELKGVSELLRWQWAAARRVHLSADLLRVLKHHMAEEGKIYWITSLANAEVLQSREKNCRVKCTLISQEYYLMEFQPHLP